MSRLFALVDCNNFYVSCERVFDPSLSGRPVIVLSNNDGCVVARSSEAKEIGIPFAAPYFKFRALAERHNTAVFSSNYTLYADMSGRVMSLLSSMSPAVEVYSIDEAFLCFSGFRGDLCAMGYNIRERVRRETGIPVSVGIAPTKTLAKAAAHLAKREKSSGGVVQLTMENRLEYLEKIDVGSIWGIGRRYAEKLKSRGIYSAASFASADEKWVRSNMTITGLRTLLELNGHSCIPIDEAPAPKKAIVTSKSFGNGVGSFEALRQSVSCYAARAAEKLRAERGIASMVTVFIMTDRFRDEPQHSASLSCELPEASSDTTLITRYAFALLKRLYREGYRYRKAGIMLSGISGAGSLQMNLFIGAEERGSPELMKTLDRINGRYGSGTLFYASSGIEKTWGMRRALLSPAYTTRWSDIVNIRI